MNEGVPNYGIADDYPSLWAISKAVDDNERLGRTATILGHEVGAALRELWDARRESRERSEA